MTLPKIFLVLDRSDQERDRRLAQHIVSLYTHQHSLARPAQDILDTETLKDYIAYARAHIHPVLSDDVRFLFCTNIGSLTGCCHSRHPQSLPRNMWLCGD